MTRSCVAGASGAIAVLLAVGCAGARGSVATASWRPSIDAEFAKLPATVRIADFVPGRFAGTYEYEGMGGCSQSWYGTTSRATVVLDLAADGGATGCRGRSYHDIIGPTRGRESGRRVHETTYVEQQGMRGRWRRDARTIVVDLDLDATVCPARAQGMTPGPWHLRCAFLEPAPKDDSLRAPVLACALRDRQWPGNRSVHWEDQAGYVSHAVPQGPWVLLGPGAGIRFEDHPYDASFAMPSDVKWLPATTPIPYDDWAATRQ